MGSKCRILTTPHRLLNPNSPVRKKDRAELDWPLPIKSAVVIKFAFRRELRNATSLCAFEGAPKVPTKRPIILRFTVCYERGRKVLDWDNCCATLKGIIDGLGDAKWFVNDNQVQGIFITQQVLKGPQGYVDVEMEEL